MPTLPPEGARPRVDDSHKARYMAESFGVDAARYDRTRPPYPDDLVRRVADAIPGPDVLDVGCGTGIAARQFQAAGRAVLGVEPDARMADYARATGVPAEVATFEDWDPAGRTFDAVVAATAWHWVDPVAGAAKAARVLRPGGRVALLWHVFELPADVGKAFVEVYQRVVPDAPFGFGQHDKPAMEVYQAMFAKAADGIRAAGGFAATEQWRVTWERTYTRDAWLDQMPTQGALTYLEPDQVAAVLDGVGAAIDAMGGAFTMPYDTVAVTTTRR